MLSALAHAHVPRAIIIMVVPAPSAMRPARVVPASSFASPV